VNVASFTYGFVAFVIYLGGVMTLLRMPLAASPAAIVVLAALALYPMGLALALLAADRLQFWNFSSTYWFFTLVFLMTFGAIYKSISLRILLDLLGRPGHADSYAAILARYVHEESYEHRLGVILDNKYAARSANGFELTDKGRRLASKVQRVQQIFAIRQSG
jgi:hypothetical protein